MREPPHCLPAPPFSWSCSQHCLPSWSCPSSPCLPWHIWLLQPSPVPSFLFLLLLHVWPRLTSQLISTLADKILVPIPLPSLPETPFKPSASNTGNGRNQLLPDVWVPGRHVFVSLSEVCCLVRHTMGKVLEICSHSIPVAPSGMFKLMASPASQTKTEAFSCSVPWMQ